MSSPDLLVNDAVLSGVVNALKSAAQKVDPVASSIGRLDAGPVGAEPLETALSKAHTTLCTALGMLGLGMAGLADGVTSVGTAMEDSDRFLSKEAPRMGGRAR